MPYLPGANELISLLLAKFIHPYEWKADYTFIISFTTDRLTLSYNLGQVSKYLNNQNINQQNAFENYTLEILGTFF